MQNKYILSNIKNKNIHHNIVLHSESYFEFFAIFVYI